MLIVLPPEKEQKKKKDDPPSGVCILHAMLLGPVCWIQSGNAFKGATLNMDIYINIIVKVT